jgi:hypothetical protein
MTRRAATDIYLLPAYLFLQQFKCMEAKDGIDGRSRKYS